MNLGVGNTFGSVGDVIGGDKVMGDKVTGDKHVHYGAPKPATDDPAHLQGLLDDTTRHLQVLERQAAQFGIYTPPYVQTGIDDARREIARLKALLEKK